MCSIPTHLQTHISETSKTPLRLCSLGFTPRHLTLARSHVLLPRQWVRRTALWRWRSGSRPTTRQTRASNREPLQCATTRAAPSTADARSTPAAAARLATLLPRPGAQPVGKTLHSRARQVRCRNEVSRMCHPHLHHLIGQSFVRNTASTI